MAEKGLSKNRIISELSKSTHGDYKSYLVVGHEAARQEPEFLAHLISWNHIKGQIRDSKVALPMVSLSCSEFNDREFVNNSLAHLASLDPRNLIKALKFGHQIKTSGNTRAITRTVTEYLRARERNWSWWEKTAVQHRDSLRTLYALSHTKPSALADAILFGRHKGFDKIPTPPNSVFEVIKQLKNMSPAEAAGNIMERRIPLLIAMGALGAKAKDPDVVLALINRMTATELVTNTNFLDKCGMKTNPALRAAYEEGLKKVASSKKNVLKTTRAAEALGDTELAGKLKAVQEKQLDNMSLEGDWLVLGDKSGSMSACIEGARQVAGQLARAAQGKVYLVFFDTTPVFYDVTGKTLEEIQKTTQRVSAGGGTSIGCGVQYIVEKKLEIDGIAVVSDAAENSTPRFVDAYRALAKQLDKSVPAYLYRFGGTMSSFSDRDLAASCRDNDVDLHEFDCRGKFDYYSLPNLVQTMRTNRYSLVDEIMAARLLTVEDVLNTRKGEAYA